jgi:hypothetical protein
MTLTRLILLLNCGWLVRSNGVLLASSFHTAIFSLLTALVVYSAKNLFVFWERNPNVNWNSSNTGEAARLLLNLLYPMHDRVSQRLQPTCMGPDYLYCSRSILYGT